MRMAEEEQEEDHALKPAVGEKAKAERTPFMKQKRRKYEARTPFGQARIPLQGSSFLLTLRVSCHTLLAQSLVMLRHKLKVCFQKFWVVLKAILPNKFIEH